MTLKPVILGRFGGERKCYGHCDQPASLRILQENGELVMATVCAKGYVSRVMVYGPGDNRTVMKSLIGSALGPKGDFSDEDVRTATRYYWDMGMEKGGDNDILFRVAYWTQNYRRTKNSATDRDGLFTCTQCNTLFVQPISSLKTVCTSCSSKGRR